MPTKWKFCDDELFTRFINPPGGCGLLSQVVGSDCGVTGEDEPGLDAISEEAIAAALLFSPSVRVESMAAAACPASSGGLPNRTDATGAWHVRGSPIAAVSPIRCSRDAAAVLVRDAVLPAFWLVRDAALPVLWPAHNPVPACPALAWEESPAAVAAARERSLLAAAARSRCACAASKTKVAGGNTSSPSDSIC